MTNNYNVLDQGPSREFITERIADGTSPTLTIANIPQVYTNLRAIVLMRTTLTGGSSTQHCYCKPNGDATAADYFFQEVRGLGAAVSAVELDGVGALIAVGPPDDGVANSWGIGECTIYAYRLAAHKILKSSMGARFTAASGFTGIVWQVSYWKSTAVVTSLDFTAEGGNWKAGTRIRLFGEK